MEPKGFIDSTAHAIEKVCEPVLQKMKNPFTSTFIFSWIVFNWKPIAFFVFSKVDVLSKISLINSNYSDFSHVLLYPFITAFVIFVSIPYILEVREKLTKWSHKWSEERTQSDELAKIEKQRFLDEAKYFAAKQLAETQKITDKNVRFAELSATITDLRKQLKEVETKNLELITDHHEQIQEYSKAIQELSARVPYDRRIADGSNWLQMRIYNNSAPKIIKIGDVTYLEVLDKRERILYYDIAGDALVDKFEIFDNYEKFGLKEISDSSLLGTALENIQRHKAIRKIDDRFRYVIG